MPLVLGGLYLKKNSKMNKKKKGLFYPGKSHSHKDAKPNNDKGKRKGGVLFQACKKQKKKNKQKMHNLVLQVFRFHVMDHLGIGDMLALQYTCKHTHYLVSNARTAFLLHLRTEMDNTLEKWIGIPEIVSKMVVHNTESVKTAYTFFGGSGLLRLVNRETWKPRDIDQFVIAKDRSMSKSPQPESIYYFQQYWVGLTSDGYPPGFWSYKLKEPIPNALLPWNLVVDTEFIGYRTYSHAKPISSTIAWQAWMSTRLDLDFIKLIYDGEKLFIMNTHALVYRTSIMGGPTTENPDKMVGRSRRAIRALVYEYRGFHIADVP
jgi:hypothetical protein